MMIGLVADVLDDHAQLLMHSDEPRIHDVDEEVPRIEQRFVRLGVAECEGVKGARCLSPSRSKYFARAVVAPGREAVFADVPLFVIRKVRVGEQVGSPS